MADITITAQNQRLLSLIYRNDQDSNYHKCKVQKLDITESLQMNRNDRLHRKNSNCYLLSFGN